MKYLANFVILTIIYLTQCQNIETVHNYILKSGVEGHILAPPLENRIFELENYEDNYRPVFQPEKSTLAPREYAPPHPPEYQVPFAPPRVLDQRPIDLKFTSRKTRQARPAVTPTEEKYKNLFGSVGSKVLSNPNSTLKRALKRDIPDDIETPVIPTLNFAVLPSIKSENNFNEDLSPVSNDGVTDKRNDLFVHDTWSNPKPLPKLTFLNVLNDAESPVIPTLNFAVLPSSTSKDSFLVLPSASNNDVAEKTDSLFELDSSVQVDTPQSIQTSPAVQVEEAAGALAPMSEHVLPAQLTSLLPTEDQQAIAWNAKPNEYRF